jgi:predicted RNA-binding protein with TRAM domain
MREFGGSRFGRGRSSGGFGGRSGGGFGGRSGGFGGGRRDFGSSRDVPVKVGEEYDVEITEVGSRGDGIARIQNFVVFVAGTKKGDKVRIKITDIRGRSAIGEVVGGSEGASEEAPTEPVEMAAEGESEESGEEL